MPRAHSLRCELPSRRAVLVGLFSTISLLTFAPPSMAGEDGRGVVYIESNTPVNTILGFRRDSNGHLTPLPGSPYATGGSGVHPTADLSPANLGPFDSDENMQIAGNRLFAVNSGSDTIAVFNIRSNGSLAPVSGSPFPSGGVNPVSVGISGNVLVVANKDYDLGRPGFTALARRPNYTSFRISSQGRLIPIPNSTIIADSSGIAGPEHPVPTQMHVAKGGTVVFDATFLGFTIESFRLNPNGRLVRAASQRLPSNESPTADNPLGAPVPLGLETHPNAPVLYVGFVLDHKIGVYEYDRRTGGFGFIRSVLGTGDVLNGVCWLVSNRQGTRLYVANNFSNTISVLNIENARNPVVIQTVGLAQGGGLPAPFTGRAAPFQIGLDSAGRFLHVVTQLGVDGQSAANANSLQVLRVDKKGLLTLVDFMPLGTSPSRPQGVVAR